MTCPVCGAHCVCSKATALCCDCHPHKARATLGVAIDDLDHDRGPASQPLFPIAHPELWLCQVRNRDGNRSASVVEAMPVLRRRENRNRRRGRIHDLPAV
jgi:hypothetical protein